jgi:hypothetical protein
LHLLGRQFAWEGDFNFAGELGIPASLGLFDGVPQVRPVVHPGGGFIGGQYRAEVHPAFTLVVVHQSAAFVHDVHRRPVGGGTGGAPPGAAADELHAQVIDGHNLPTQLRGGRGRSP